MSLLNQKFNYVSLKKVQWVQQDATKFTTHGNSVIVYIFLCTPIIRNMSRAELFDEKNVSDYYIRKSK